MRGNSTTGFHQMQLIPLLNLKHKP